MALIEGVGDEVTLLFGSLLVLLVLLLAWASTRTADPPDPFTPPAGPAPSPRPGDTPPPPSSSSAFSSSSASDGSADAPPAAPAQEEEEGAAAGEEGAEPVAASQRNMVVRLKFLNDTERTAQVKPQDTIGYIKRTYFAGQEHQVRLIYQGQLLQDDAQTLASLNLAHNCVLHCHISAAARRGGAAARPADPVAAALNVGSLMVPLLVLMLSVLWYCQIQYRQFFTAPATASLVGVTIFLSMVAFGVYRH